MQDSVILDVFHDDDAILRGEEKEGGGFSRPEMDEELETELTDRDLPFYTCPLVKNGDNSGKPAGYIRYLLEVAKWDNEAENKKAKENFNKNIALVTKIQKKPDYICRLYFLFASNLTAEKTDKESKAYIWIKRCLSDTELKMDQESFEIFNPIIDKMREFEVTWPVNQITKIKINSYRKHFSSIFKSYDQEVLQTC